MAKVYGKLLKNSIIIPVILLAVFVLIIKYPALQESYGTSENGKGADILVINKDMGSELTESLMKYLGRYGSLIISDSVDADIDYLSSVQYDYIVDIPKYYQRDFMNGNPAAVKVTGTRKEERLSLAEMVNAFLSIGQEYLKNNGNRTPEELAGYLDRTMEKEIRVVKEQEDFRYLRNLYFSNYIEEAAYFMIFLSFFAIVRISGYFGRRGIHKRHKIAPISLAGNDMRLFFSNLGYILACNGIFAALMLLLEPKIYMDFTVPVYLLNLLVYSLAVLGICQILTSLSLRHGISTILIILFGVIMGILNGKIGAVNRYLSAAAEFTPIYWLKKINAAAGDMEGFTWQSLNPILFMLGMNILMAGAYFSVSLVIRKVKMEKE